MCNVFVLFLLPDRLILWSRKGTKVVLQFATSVKNRPADDLFLSKDSFQDRQNECWFVVFLSRNELLTIGFHQK